MTNRQLLSLFALISVVAILWMMRTDPGPGKVLAFELAGERTTAERIVGPFNGDVWRKMRESFHRDSLFLFAYTGYFVIAGLFFARFTIEGSWAIVLLAQAAGISDILENTYALGALSHAMDGETGGQLAAMVAWSRVKWGLLGPLTLILAFVNARYVGGIWGWLTAACFLVSGLGYTAGIAAAAVIEWRVLFLGIALGMLAELVTVWRQGQL